MPQLFRLTIFLPALVFSVAGCTYLGVYDEHAAKRAQVELVGKTQAEIYDCVGNPAAHRRKGDRETLIYRTKRSAEDHDGTMVKETCTVTFALNGGKVTRMDYDLGSGGSATIGGACKEIVKFCLP